MRLLYFLQLLRKRFFTFGQLYQLGFGLLPRLSQLLIQCLLAFDELAVPRILLPFVCLLHFLQLLRKRFFTFGQLYQLGFGLLPRLSQLLIQCLLALGVLAVQNTLLLFVCLLYFLQLLRKRFFTFGQLYQLGFGLLPRLSQLRQVGLLAFRMLAVLHTLLLFVRLLYFLQLLRKRFFTLGQLYQLGFDLLPRLSQLLIQCLLALGALAVQNTLLLFVCLLYFLQLLRKRFFTLGQLYQLGFDLLPRLSQLRQVGLLAFAMITIKCIKILQAF